MLTDDGEISEDLIFNTEKDNTLINFNGYQIKPVQIVPDINNVDVNEVNNIKAIDEIFLSRIIYNPAVSLLTFLLASGLGILSALPLISYEKNVQIETIFDEITCIIRGIYGMLIFTGCWFDLIDNFYQYMFKNLPEHRNNVLKTDPYVYTVKTTAILLFAGIYSLPYAWNYWILPNTIIRYITVPLYFLILLKIFYQRTVIQFKTTSNSSEVDRKKNILIASVKRTIKICKENPEYANIVLDELNDTTILPNFLDHKVKYSLLFAVKNDHTFYRYDKEDLTNQYENDIYDKWKTIRINLLNLFLGVIYIALFITLTNQYENLIVGIFHSFNITNINYDIGSILWGATWIAMIEAILFILATYSIHHSYVKKIMSLNNFKVCKEKFRSLIIYSPMILAGVILAMTRLESSYIAFAKLATLLQLKRDIGFFLIVVGMGLSFLVEMSFMIKTSIYIFNKSMREIMTNSWIPDCVSSFTYFKHKRNVAYLIMHSKRMIAIIDNLTDDCVLQLMRNILQR